MFDAVNLEELAFFEGPNLWPLRLVIYMINLYIWWKRDKSKKYICVCVSGRVG